MNDTSDLRVRGARVCGCSVCFSQSVSIRTALELALTQTARESVAMNLGLDEPRQTHAERRWIDRASVEGSGRSRGTARVTTHDWMGGRLFQGWTCSRGNLGNWSKGLRP